MSLRGVPDEAISSLYHETLISAFGGATVARLQ